MAALHYMWQTVSRVHARRQNGETLNEVQDYVLRNWRVPAEIEKLTERVEHQRGIPPGGPQ
jgi:hypothetical protein